MEDLIVLGRPTPVTVPAGLPPLNELPLADDWRWMNAERSKPGRGVFGLYEGLWVAVLNRQVVGASRPRHESEPLSRRVAERFDVPDERVVMVYIPGPDAQGG